jgi:SAM-dependent methyltransferase
VREFSEEAFDRAYAEMADGIRWQEVPEYYPRYRARYKELLRSFARAAPDRPLEVLDIGGGQFAYLASVIWNDTGCVADIEDTTFKGLRARGIDGFIWNLAIDEPPADRTFDAIFFSEVIEHLPTPGHIVLSRLRSLLRPGGVLLCSTPNLYRLRNVVYLLTGRQLFDHFDVPGSGGFGHILEYSAEHLAWQFERAGFVDYEVQLRDFTHAPNGRGHRTLAQIGKPLRRIPRYRDNLLVVATAPN